MRLLGLALNLGIVAYLGYQLSSCLGDTEIIGSDMSQDPMVLSFVAVVALFMVLKNY
jgi:hypothetical protein